MKLMLTLSAMFVPAMASANFVEDNLLAIFYHELGHAVIHQMDVPIFGQEEDAADALSILMIDAYYEPDVAEEIAYNASAVFWAEAEETPDYWDTHGPDEQRFYNTVCLFYGADPDRREGFATDLGLPQERAEGCPDEFDLAAGSWLAVLDDMANAHTAGKLVLDGAGMDVVAKEIDALNEELKWPRDITVHIVPCEEANAFYDLDEQSITMCTELVGWLGDIQNQLDM